jgi:3-oxoacyl-[acyl-carrier protein] reductase
MNIDLTGLNALVCGSTSGIGKEVALQMARSGANVTLLARDPNRLDATLKELHRNPEQCHGTLCADFTDPASLREVIGAHVAMGNIFHIVVNNTGGPAAGKAIDSATDAFVAAFTAHLLCNQILVQAVVPGMKAAAQGRIINIISTSVKQPLPGLGVSNTVRGAVANWAKTLSVELAPYGITVNNVLPGATETGRLRSIIDGKAKRTGHAEEMVRDEMLAEIPMGRFAQPWEVAAAVVFLASPMAAYINGINLPVDGGRTGCL